MTIVLLLNCFISYAQVNRNVSSTGELHLGDKTMFLSKAIAANVCSKEQLEQGVVFCTTKVFDELFGTIEFIENENSKTIS